MDFVTKSFRKDETLTSWTLLQHICPHFWACLLNTIVITPKGEDKYVVKVFNSSTGQRFNFPEMTCYKIHTLDVKKFTQLMHVPRHESRSFQHYWKLAYGSDFTKCSKQMANACFWKIDKYIVVHSWKISSWVVSVSNHKGQKF